MINASIIPEPPAQVLFTFRVSPTRTILTKKTFYTHNQVFFMVIMNLMKLAMEIDHLSFL